MEAIICELLWVILNNRNIKCLELDLIELGIFTNCYYFFLVSHVSHFLSSLGTYYEECGNGCLYAGSELKIPQLLHVSNRQITSHVNKSNFPPYQTTFILME